MTSFKGVSTILIAGIGILVLMSQGCSRKPETTSDAAKPKADATIRTKNVSPNDQPNQNGSLSAKSTSAVAEKKTILGDLDGDGTVTVKDARIAANISVGKLKSTPDQLKAGDLNGDGEITISEATAILRAAKKGIPLHRNPSPQRAATH